MEPSGGSRGSQGLPRFSHRTWAVAQRSSYLTRPPKSTPRSPRRESCIHYRPGIDPRESATQMTLPPKTGIDLGRSGTTSNARNKCMVQATLCTANVSPSAVRELRGTLQAGHAIVGILVTTSDFASDAESLGRPPQPHYRPLPRHLKGARLSSRSHPRGDLDPRRRWHPGACRAAKARPGGPLGGSDRARIAAVCEGHALAHPRERPLSGKSEAGQAFEPDFSLKGD